MNRRGFLGRASAVVAGFVAAGRMPKLLPARDPLDNPLLDDMRFTAPYRYVPPRTPLPEWTWRRFNEGILPTHDPSGR